MDYFDKLIKNEWTKLAELNDEAFLSHFQGMPVVLVCSTRAVAKPKGTPAIIAPLHICLYERRLERESIFCISVWSGDLRTISTLEKNLIRNEHHLTSAFFQGIELTVDGNRFVVPKKEVERITKRLSRYVSFSRRGRDISKRIRENFSQKPRQTAGGGDKNCGENIIQLPVKLGRVD